MKKTVEIEAVLAMLAVGATLQELCDWLIEEQAGEEPVRFMLDMDGSMVPDADGEWVRV